MEPRERRKLMVLGAGATQISTIEKAIDMGIEVIAVDKDKDAMGFRIIPNEANRVNISIKDTDAVLAVAKDRQIDGVIAPQADAGLRTMGRINTSMGLRGPDHTTVICATNKKVFNSLVEDSNAVIKGTINVPEIFEDFDEYLFPLIVKPVNGVGSRGVYRVDSFYQKPHPNTLLEQARKHSGSAIIQRYIPGTVFEVDLIVQGGEIIVYTIFDEVESDNNFGACMFIHPSSYIRKGAGVDIHNAVLEVIKLLGIRDGSISIEGIVYRDKVYIIDVNPRMAGAHLPDIHSQYSNVDWIEYSILVSLGIPVPPVSRYISQPYGVYLGGVDKEGVIKDIVLGDSFFKSKIDSIWFWKHAGDYVYPSNGQETSSDQVVYVFSAGLGNTKLAANMLRDESRHIHVEVE